MSIVEPRCLRIIAEHSMCQPGRPRPHGLSQPGSSGVDGFHNTKSFGIAFVRRHFDARAVEHVFERAVRQHPVVGIRRYVEQHVSVGRIRVTALDEPLDHRDDFGDVVRCARFERRRQIAERPDVLVVRNRESLGEFGDRLVAVDRGFVDLVVDVGDVGGVAHLRIFGRQQPIQHVEDDRRPAVADVHEVVDRRSADVHRHAVRIERCE